MHVVSRRFPQLRQLLSNVHSASFRAEGLSHILQAPIHAPCPSPSLAFGQLPREETACTLGAQAFSWKGESGLRDGGPMAESQLAEVRNMRILLEEARMLARNLAYHRRARLEEVLGRALEEADRQIEELCSERHN